MSTILLTGATGFVGRHILNELQQREHKVIAPVRSNWQARIEIDTRLTQVVETKDLFFEDYDWWCKALDGVDIIVHSAWYADPGSYLVSEKNLDCLSTTVLMAKAAAAAGVKRFVGLGTCLEYEMSNDHPLTTDSPLAPTTPYSAAKVAAFFALQQWLKQEGISFLWCRLFHLFGDGEHPNRLVPFLHENLKNGSVVDLTSGRQIRDFIAVENAAKMIVDGTMSTLQGPANICSGKGRSVRALAEEIADLYGRRDLLNFGARADNLVDPAMIVGVPTKVR